jgi:alpha,alpha-trehalase
VALFYPHLDSNTPKYYLCKMYYFIEDLQPLYQDVQSSGLFDDSKFFPDSTPKRNPKNILADYSLKKTARDFDLLDFLNQNFEFPADSIMAYSHSANSVEQHITSLWDHLTRVPATTVEIESTLINLPYPYVVPGGRFREIYYWDSYFTILGLMITGKKDLAWSMVKNFEWLIHRFGFIPNGNRTYYLSRSQPPIFALMVDLLCHQDLTEMAAFLPAIETEYNFWMSNRLVQMPDGEYLNRYWDNKQQPRPEAWLEDTHLANQSNRKPEEVWLQLRAAAESGWDFSSRWFENPLLFSTIQTTSIVPVDLNCLLHFIETTLYRIHQHIGNHTTADAYQNRSNQRKMAIQKYFWSENDGFFFDFNLKNQCKSTSKTLAAAFPLFFFIASEEQASKTAQLLEKEFLQPGGFVTTVTKSGQQWDAPNGWPPLQWIVYKGLRNYKMDHLAAEARQRWIALNENVFTTTGKMMEKYNVEDLSLPAGGGEYPNQDGFGWTNGVYLALKAN